MIFSSVLGAVCHWKRINCAFIAGSFSQSCEWLYSPRNTYLVLHSGKTALFSIFSEMR